MSLKKKCPSCGSFSPEAEVFCPQCCADLTAVKAELLGDTDVSTSIRASIAPSISCPKCRTENPDYAILCTKPGCGAVLGQAATLPGECPPLQASAAPSDLPEGPAKKLLLVVGSTSYECKSGDVLGRNGTLANHVFAGIKTVSARHVAVELRAGQWHLINLPIDPGKSQKNPTMLDGRSLSPGQAAPLSGVHTLKMSSGCGVKLRVGLQ